MRNTKMGEKQGEKQGIQGVKSKEKANKNMEKQEGVRHKKARLIAR